MSDKQRHAWAVYCDDIRHEIGNKMSFMGIYNAEMYFNEFPSLLPKLSIVAYCQTNVHKLIKDLKCEIYIDDALAISHDITQNMDPPSKEALIERGTEQDPIELIYYTFSTQFNNLLFDKPTTIKAIFIADGETISAGKLRVKAVSANPPIQ